MDIIAGLEGAKAIGPGNRGQSRPFARFEPQIATKRLGNQQNIGKQDRGIESVTPDRLQGDFGGQLRIVAQRQEIARLRPCFAVFGQIAARLPHHPDRRYRLGFTGKGTQYFLGHSGLHPPLHRVA